MPDPLTPATSPLPWRWDGFVIRDANNELVLIAAERGGHGVLTELGFDPPDMDLILAAVNSHAALVEALRWYADPNHHHDKFGDYDMAYMMVEDNAGDRARAALAQLEKEVTT